MLKYILGFLLFFNINLFAVDTTTQTLNNQKSKEAQAEFLLQGNASTWDLIESLLYAEKMNSLPYYMANVLLDIFSSYFYIYLGIIVVILGYTAILDGTRGLKRPLMESLIGIGIMATISFFPSMEHQEAKDKFFGDAKAFVDLESKFISLGGTFANELMFQVFIGERKPDKISSAEQIDNFFVRRIENTMKLKEYNASNTEDMQKLENQIEAIRDIAKQEILIFKSQSKNRVEKLYDIPHYIEVPTFADYDSIKEEMNSGDVPSEQKTLSNSSLTNNIEEYKKINKNLNIIANKMLNEKTATKFLEDQYTLIYNAIRAKMLLNQQYRNNYNYVPYDPTTKIFQIDDISACEIYKDLALALNKEDDSQQNLEKMGCNELTKSSGLTEKKYILSQIYNNTKDYMNNVAKGYNDAFLRKESNGEITLEDKDPLFLRNAYVKTIQEKIKFLKRISNSNVKLNLTENEKSFTKSYSLFQDFLNPEYKIIFSQYDKINNFKLFHQLILGYIENASNSNFIKEKQIFDSKSTDNYNLIGYSKAIQTLANFENEKLSDSLMQSVKEDIFGTLANNKNLNEGTDNIVKFRVLNDNNSSVALKIKRNNEDYKQFLFETMVQNKFSWADLGSVYSTLQSFINENNMPLYLAYLNNKHYEDNMEQFWRDENNITIKNDADRILSQTKTIQKINDIGGTIQSFEGVILGGAAIIGAIDGTSEYLSKKAMGNQMGKIAGSALFMKAILSKTMTFWAKFIVAPKFFIFMLQNIVPNIIWLYTIMIYYVKAAIVIAIAPLATFMLSILRKKEQFYNALFVLLNLFLTPIVMVSLFIIILELSTVVPVFAKKILIGSDYQEKTIRLTKTLIGQTENKQKLLEVVNMDEKNRNKIIESSVGGLINPQTKNTINPENMSINAITQETQKIVKNTQDNSNFMVFLVLSALKGMTPDEMSTTFTSITNEEDSKIKNSSLESVVLLPYIVFSDLLVAAISFILNIFMLWQLTKTSEYVNLIIGGTGISLNTDELQMNKILSQFKI